MSTALPEPRSTRRAGRNAHTITRDLIFDVGVNHGEDTAFYLAKGFRVVGVEADPIIAEELRLSFASELADGRFTLINAGVWDQAKTLPFYRNLETDHWSSFDPSYGCRNQTRYEVLSIPCRTIIDFLEEYGCPYYMKIDVEGADRLVLEVLRETSMRPRFLSIEEYSIEAFELLFELGYNMFSLRTQENKSWATPPNPPKEGAYVVQSFANRDSGLFGLEIPEWLPLETAKNEYRRKVRSDSGQWLPPPGEWYDIHATFWPSRINDRPL